MQTVLRQWVNVTVMIMLFLGGSLTASEKIVIKPFPIMPWVGPALEQEQMKLFKEAGFTVMFIYPDQEDYVKLKKLWDGNFVIFKEWNIKGYTYDDMLNFHPEDPKRIGFLMGDEPLYSQIKEYKPLFDKFRAKSPQSICFVNLFPSYVGETRLGGSYQDYVENYFAELKPRYCSLDHYPCLRFDVDSPTYYYDLETLRRYAIKNNSNRIGFVQTYSGIVQRDVSESDVAWQVNSLLAYGCKGLWYYCFRSPGAAKAYAGEEKPEYRYPKPLTDGVMDLRKGKGILREYYKQAYSEGPYILDFNDRPTPVYNYVKKVNVETLAWGDCLLKLNNIAVRHIAGFQQSFVPVGTEEFAVSTEKYINSVTTSQTTDDMGFIVSYFEDAQRQPYVMIVNKRHGEFMSRKGGTLPINVSLKDNVEKVFVVSNETGKEDETKIVNHNVSFQIDGGGAVLCRLIVGQSSK
jgi:hypothetical protein